MWLRRHFVAFVIFFAALVTIADGSLSRAETHRMEEPCGIALIGACLPRRVVAWERTQGAVVEATQGFTLVEIAIVLMVIGLIVGGILWGAEMIGQATTRAQISQLEKFNVAANTFKTKYGYLPGDIPDPYASQFGFAPRGPYAGEGDGNGIIQGIFPGGYGEGTNFGAGENMLFWVDLSVAGFIEGGFASASATNITSVAAAALPQYLPAAKIGNGNYVYAYSGWWNTNGGQTWGTDGINYFGLAALSGIGGAPYYLLNSAPGLTVAQAYSIDKKIDDGLPQSGKIQAAFPNGSSGLTLWAGTFSQANVPLTSATGSSSSCFDNGGSGTMQYSMEISNGSNVNCALSFQMQGAGR